MALRDRFRPLTGKLALLHSAAGENPFFSDIVASSLPMKKRPSHVLCSTASCRASDAFLATPHEECAVGRRTGKLSSATQAVPYRYQKRRRPAIARPMLPCRASSLRKPTQIEPQASPEGSWQNHENACTKKGKQQTARLHGEPKFKISTGGLIPFTIDFAQTCRTSL